jgi:murein DD-endopeptidase MepM/ murein hydrolase activator NlpD
VLGDGFLIRHGYACENTWYNPGWLHTAEDFYLPNGNTAGAGVYAVADGEIAFAGSEYPGLVVIVQHAADLYSMYGHLDHTLAVEHGRVERGQLLGTVLDRTDGRVPSHLHFEMRTFLVKTEVNGDAPRYAVRCGFNCAPGPGYWPMDAPEHPSDIGWRNPTHVIANRSYGDALPADAEIVVASGSGSSAALWSAPSNHDDAEQIGDLPLNAGDHYRLLSIATGPEASMETSAEGYRLWYRIELPDRDRVWVQAATPSRNDTGSDGRPSTIRVDFLPAVEVAAD